jgi:hypothetical protein
LAAVPIDPKLKELDEEIKKARKRLRNIEKQNKLFGVNLDSEEAQARVELKNAEEELDAYKKEKEESQAEVSAAGRIRVLQTRILSEQSRLDGLKSPDRKGGFLIAPANEERVRKLEKSLYDKEQEIKSLGGELRTPTKFDLFTPKAPSTVAPNITDKAQVSGRLSDLYGDGRRVVSSPMDDLLGGGRLPAKALFDLPENAIIERKSDGTFDVDGLNSIFVYDRSNNVLRPQGVESFYNNLYTLRPNVIAEYKKGLGYKAEDINGVLTEQFKKDFFDAAKAVSEYSYGYGRTGVKKPIDLVQYLIAPDAYPEIKGIIGQQKSGGAGTGGAVIDANKLAANVDTIRLLETELGASLTKQQRNKIARDLATGRVNATTLPSTIAKAGNIALEEGQAATLKAALKQSAADNGVFFDENWYDNTTKNILQGKLTQDTANAEILKQAKLKYAAPSIVAGLDAGFSVRDQASQYTNWLAQVRGIDPRNISLDDPILQKAFMDRNNEGMPVQMNMYDWQTWAKENDPAYATSSMAEDSYMSALRAIGQAFGKSI